MGGAERHARRAEVGNGHSQQLLTMIDDVLAEASLELTDCDAIAFSAGPGSFTGLRVACAVAQGLAFGAGLPVAAIGTLDAIAHSVLGALDGDAATVLVAQDARMGEVYWALVACTAGRPTTVAGPALCAPDRLGDAVRAALHVDDRGITLGCGNAWAVHGARLEGLVPRVIERASADAVDVAMLGIEAFRAGRTTDAAGASPVYVRDRVAQTTVERDTARGARLPAARPSDVAIATIVGHGDANGR